MYLIDLGSLHVATSLLMEIGYNINCLICKSFLSKLIILLLQEKRSLLFQANITLENYTIISDLDTILAFIPPPTTKNLQLAYKNLAGC